MGDKEKYFRSLLILVFYSFVFTTVSVVFFDADTSKAFFLILAGDLLFSLFAAIVNLLYFIKKLGKIRFLLSGTFPLLITLPLYYDSGVDFYFVHSFFLVNFLAAGFWMVKEKD